jgi:hypothetical protein
VVGGGQWPELREREREREREMNSFLRKLSNIFQIFQIFLIFFFKGRWRARKYPAHHTWLKITHVALSHVVNGRHV